MSGTPLTIDVFNYPGLCTMTEVYETNPHAYCHELEAQVDKTLTQHQASVLMTLVKTLY